jgi:uncharacterized protein (UPF0548 family)
MFSLHRPPEAEIQEQLRRTRGLRISYGIDLRTEGGREQVLCPRGFARDYHRSRIGHGEADFTAAKAAFRQWLQFDLGWVRVANTHSPIRQGEAVAVEAHTLGLWSVNISLILYVIDEPDRFGFGYGTTPMHVERGEERFLIEYYPVSGEVYYDLLAVSQPAHWLARVGYPFTRLQQKRFARDSHRRMRRAIQHSSSDPQGTSRLRANLDLANIK